MKVAAAHATPVFMNKKASIDKVLEIIRDATKHEANLLVFPEVFIPGFPSFAWAYAPLSYFETLLEYGEHSVSIFDSSPDKESPPKPSADLRPILQACKDAQMNVVLGVSERSNFSAATTLFNSQLFISSSGELLGVHRKLVPTFAERSVWAYGGGATLRCWDMPAVQPGKTFKIGGLCCGENLNRGAQIALLEEGQQIHAASWPGQCAFRGMEGTWAEIKVLAQSHSVGSMTFTIAASSIVGAQEREWMKDRFGEQSVVGEGSGWSGIVSPTGKVLAEECGGTEERLLVAEIDLDSIPLAKLMNDPVGHYKRPEVISLTVDRRPIWPDDALVANPQRKRSADDIPKR